MGLERRLLGAGVSVAAVAVLRVRCLGPFLELRSGLFLRSSVLARSRWV